MIEKLEPSDPRYDEAYELAVAEVKADTGMDITQVLLPGQWLVGLWDGRPRVLLNEAGLRAIAMVAPRADAREYVDELIETMRKIEKG